MTNVTYSCFLPGTLPGRAAVAPPPGGRRYARLGTLLWLLLLLGACRPDTDPAPTITIFAAASLSEAFTELAANFKAQQPAVEVRLNFAGSQQLAQQLAQGAPADLFASADARQMTGAVAAGRIAADAIRPFAANQMVVVVPAGNPAAITSLVDLARPGVKLVLAAETVPAGHYARTVLARIASATGRDDAFVAAVLANVVSDEQNVRAVLTKVSLGEADAGIVYASDAPGANVDVVEIPDNLNVRARYLLAPVADSTHPELAHAFADFALSRRGQRILAEHHLQPITEP